MKNHSATTLSCPSSASTYRIQVRGILNPKWADYLGTLHILPERSARDEPLTTLYGPVQDQAALLGVLNLLYDLHYTILLVECTDEPRQTPEIRSTLKAGESG